MDRMHLRHLPSCRSVHALSDGCISCVQPYTCPGPSQDGFGTHAHSGGKQLEPETIGHPLGRTALREGGSQVERALLSSEPASPGRGLSASSQRALRGRPPRPARPPRDGPQHGPEAAQEPSRAVTQTMSQPLYEASGLLETKRPATSWHLTFHSTVFVLFCFPHRRKLLQTGLRRVHRCEHVHICVQVCKIRVQCTTPPPPEVYSESVPVA